MNDDRSDRETKQTTLIAALRRPEAYPHPAERIELLDTHISWVLLAGEFAYKIKKDVKLEFLDFSTLELRRHFCEEELRLNRRWAPDLYLEVVSISGSAANPVIGGCGDVIEYAVKMHRFPQEAQLDRQLAAGLLDPRDALDLAETIAEYHAASEPLAYVDDADALAHIRQPMLDNFAPLEPLVDGETLRKLERWTRDSLVSLEATLIRRRRDGFVRDCHGDLNLTNLVRLPSGIVAYDCVEFSAELRNIDVMSDVSFVFMDLIVRGREDLAYLLLNRYLERTGDYRGMAVLGLYFVYHCLIRAKIAAIRAGKRPTEQGKAGDLAEIDGLVKAACDWLYRPPPVLIAMHGYSGSGKTWLSGHLLQNLPAIRVRSDIERKRLHGLAEFGKSNSGLGEGLYSDAASMKVYERLLQLARDVLASGCSVIIDASFLGVEERDQVARLAAKAAVPLLYLDTIAGNGELRRRLQERSASGKHVSEADIAVLDYQYENAEPLTAAEESMTLRVETTAEIDFDRLRRRILERGDVQSVQ